ncbi:MAG: NAD(P)/FAD-dependent oxidoreductase [Chitinispirillaceae bacterium]|nr:NAD(P)/FAD-dependent oxidoreductase [Chitinispirillaceae bacterium]
MKHSSRIHTVDIAIIGGGASGMAAAWFARRCSREYAPGLRIALLERNERLGKKLLSTGNGRCNLTNLDSNGTRFHGTDPSFTQTAFLQFPPLKIITLFEEMGVVCTVEDEQKVYPASLHASSVLDALRCALDESGIELFTGCKITSISKNGTVFSLAISSEETVSAKTVIVATGGMSAPATGSDGNGYKLLSHFSHRCTPTAPSLVQLTTDTSFVKPLSGHKIRGAVTLLFGNEPVRQEQGELLFTDYGLSGPPILQLSGHVSRALHIDHLSKPVTVVIDFLPGYTFDETRALLQKRKAAFAGRALEEFLTGLFQRRLAYGLLKKALGRPLSSGSADLSDQDITALVEVCKRLPIPVTGTKSFTQAQVTAGGIATADFNPATMASLNCPGLFACGELLDIDGDCGGFNLQWAWASGFLAGGSSVDYLQEKK